MTDITRGIEIISAAFVDITRDIEILLARSTTVTRSIEINSVEPVSISRSIIIHAHAFNEIPDNKLVWTVSALIGGVDYSSRLTGRVTIRRAVNAATLVDFAIIPVPGVINPTLFDGQTVEIGYQDERGEALLFKGKVIKPTISMSDGTLSLTCSDLLQEALSRLTHEQIDGIIPHHRSSAIYKEPADAYDYAQECLKSAEGDVFMGVDNQIIYQSWTNDAPVSFADDTVLYGSVVPTFADRHSLVNAVNIAFDYRHFIGWHRVHSLDWGIPHTYAAWVVVYFSSLPSVEMIEKAIPADCVLASKAYTPPPPSGLYSYFGTDASYVNSSPAGYTAYLASIQAAERWLQTITHKITITLTAPASIARYGEITGNARYALANDEASITFADIDSNRLFGTSAGFDDDGPLIVSDKLPPDDADNEYIDWRVITYRKKLFGKEGPPAIATGAINCAIREAAKTILASHQNVSVLFESPIQPVLTLANNAEINAEGCVATGRIKAIEHQLDISSGSAITRIELVPVSGAIDQVLTPPAVLDDPPVSVGGTAPALGLYLKDPLDATPDNDAWRGYVGNYVTQTEYAERFVVEIPEIADELRNEQTIEQSSTLTMTVVLDKIGLTL